MIDIKHLREEPAVYQQACRQKKASVDVERLLELDGRMRAVKTELQELASAKNQAGTTNSPWS